VIGERPRIVLAFFAIYVLWCVLVLASTVALLRRREGRREAAG
jgi:hypothetical protein